MGLTVQEIAHKVGELEPPRCPVCSVPDFADSAACSVLQEPNGGDGEILLISYHCKNCGNIIHTVD